MARGVLCGAGPRPGARHTRQVRVELPLLAAAAHKSCGASCVLCAFRKDGLRAVFLLLTFLRFRARIWNSYTGRKTISFTGG